MKMARLEDAVDALRLEDAVDDYITLMPLTLSLPSLPSLPLTSFEATLS